MSRVGWDGETMTRNPNDILKAKWRARRVLLDLSYFEVADLLADVTQLPQYRQIFEQAGISGKRLLNINMNVLTQLGLRQHGHQKIYFAAIKEVQKYCDDMEHVPASQMMTTKSKTSGNIETICAGDRCGYYMGSIYGSMRVFVSWH
ncbi:hypothetical protein CYMTET_31634 [Cymbomonas tetramitiformis]|uniref:SAM domain-containing protein n=1 Tax=Cymbomonas tetramitiformis TaxID=36881 RepID=A0AAE0FGT2_9CHLO|nr:hypothetical protein CYMTET_31634 [Cymbomonas tetramitiformis]